MALRGGTDSMPHKVRARNPGARHLALRGMPLTEGISLKIRTTCPNLQDLHLALDFGLNGDAGVTGDMFKALMDLPITKVRRQCCKQGSSV